MAVNIYLDANTTYGELLRLLYDAYDNHLMYPNNSGWGNAENTVYERISGKLQTVYEFEIDHEANSHHELEEQCQIIMEKFESMKAALNNDASKDPFLAPQFGFTHPQSFEDRYMMLSRVLAALFSDKKTTADMLHKHEAYNLEATPLAGEYYGTETLMTFIDRVSNNILGKGIKPKSVPWIVRKDNDHTGLIKAIEKFAPVHRDNRIHLAFDDPSDGIFQHENLWWLYVEYTNPDVDETYQIDKWENLDQLKYIHDNVRLAWFFEHGITDIYVR